MAISNGDGSIVLSTDVDTGGLKKGLTSIKGFAASAGKAIAGIAGAATIAISKMATSAFADYEQLTGGVETLFKGSAEKVKNYAKDAFYTAGVSANEYMRQVTSFSASLISSTAGDTEKAADIANMALIDISDNANKMGSSIESITNAYQGFAKQQYMLLDNLKLGYGGTKTEMERLLKDAQKITGVKYDIDNLADVYSAIHAIQEELGITGVTSAEAEKTIAGSAQMMKAAWEDTLTAIITGDDFDRVINNLVYSIQTYMDNILPAVEKSLVGIGRLVEKVLPKLVQSLTKTVIQITPQLIAAAFNMVIGAAKGVYEGIRALFTGANGSVAVELKNDADEAAKSISNIGTETEEAGKKAKKALAGFDELQILSEKAEEAPIENIVPTTAQASEVVVDVKIAETSGQSLDALLPEWLSERIGIITEGFGQLNEIDTTQLQTSLGELGTSLELFSGIDKKALSWFITEFFNPLATFVVQEGLPTFISSLAERLKGLNNIIAKIKPVWEVFYNEILKPIVNSIKEKALEDWEYFNEKLSEVETTVANSEAWQDFQIILEKISPVITAIADAIILLISEIGKFVFDAVVNDFKTFWRDIEDTLGLISAILTGDFSDAWSHMKDILWDNRMQDVEDRFNSIKTSVSNLIEPVKEFGENFKENISQKFSEFGDGLSTWWDEQVTPWFTKEKWEELFFKLGEWIANAVVGVGGFIDKWKSKISTWWDEEVTPWFTKEKWEELFKSIIDSVVYFFTDENGFVKTWKRKITTWWDEDVKPWFTVEKWKEFGQNLKDGFLKGVDGLVNGIKGIVNKVISAFESLINGAIDLVNGLIRGWNKVADVTPGLKSIKEVGRVDLSKYKFEIPPLAKGAVLPPNKPFLAMVGDQKHGTNIEAPLQTIVDAFNIALGQNGGANNTAVLEIDGEQFGKLVYKLNKQQTRRIGVNFAEAY